MGRPILDMLDLTDSNVDLKGLGSVHGKINTWTRPQSPVYDKWETWICTPWPSFPLTYALLLITSTPKVEAWPQKLYSCFELFLAAHFQFW